MIIFPAIDIRDRKCVRLKQGDYDRETVYFDSPLAVARDYEKRNVRYLHAAIKKHTAEKSAVCCV